MTNYLSNIKIENNPIFFCMGFFFLLTGLGLILLSQYELYQIFPSLFPIAIGGIMIWISMTDPRWSFKTEDKV